MKNKISILLFLLFSIGATLFAQPVNITPTNGASVIMVGGNVSLQWTVGGGPAYTLTYTVNANPPVSVPGVASPYALGGLVNGNLVSWTITDVAPATSLATTFTVIASPTPTPAHAATGVSQATASVSWTAFDEGGFGNGNYDVEFNGTDGTYGTFVTQSLNQVGTSLALPALLYNTTYYWRVRDTDIDGIGTDGTWFQYSFTTILGPPTATAASAITATSFTANWTAHVNGGATSYRLDVSDDNFTTTLVGYTNLTVAGLSQSVTGLTAGTTYKYRVRATDGSYTSINSNEITVAVITAAPTLISPATYAVGQSVLPTLSWGAVSGATGYQLQVSTVSDFSSTISLSPAYASPATSHSFTYVTTASTVLANGTIYYWRVRASNGSGNSAWSTGGEFTTVAASTPYISNITPDGTSITIYWYPLPYSGSLKYDLFQSSNSNMSGYSTVSDLTNTYYTVTGLTPGNTYYFQVRSKNTAGTVINSYSAVQQYDVPGLPKPYASYPTSGVTNYFNPPTLYWYLGTYYPSLTFVVRYRRSDQAMPVATTAQTALTGYFHTASTNYLAALTATLTAGATYYWQVASTNDGGTTLSTFSDAADFIVYSSTPAVAPVPYLSWPVGGATSYLNPPTLYWYIGTYATGLYFQVDWTGPSNFTTGWIADNLYYTILTTLSPGTYTWKVRSALTSGGGSPSAWSSTTTFVIPTSTSSVSVPYPTAPVGIEVPSLNPTLAWFAVTPPALTYIIRISPYSSTDVNGMLNHPTVQQSAWIGTTSSTYNALGLTALVAGTTYYWQVQSTTDGGTTTSSWSYVASFTTAAGALSVVPIVVSPIQGQPINTKTTILSWAVPSSPLTHLKFDVEISKNLNFSSSVKISDLNEPFAKVDGLEQNTKYYWRVKSKNQNSTSSSSSVGEFRTNNITDVQEQIIPTAFELSQNYPNPFNPTTKIAFALQQNSYVSLKIYNMLGREIKSLLNAEMLAGNHSIDWNGEDNNGFKVASGTYIYKMTAGNFMAVKKMVLIK